MILRELLGFCAHKWKVFKVLDVYTLSHSKEIPTAHEIWIQCEKCGKLKKKRM